MVSAPTALIARPRALAPGLSAAPGALRRPRHMTSRNVRRWYADPKSPLTRYQRVRYRMSSRPFSRPCWLHALATRSSSCPSSGWWAHDFSGSTATTLVLTTYRSAAHAWGRGWAPRRPLDATTPSIAGLHRRLTSSPSRARAAAPQKQAYGSGRLRDAVRLDVRYWTRWMGIRAGLSGAGAAIGASPTWFFRPLISIEHGRPCAPGSALWRRATPSKRARGACLLDSALYVGLFADGGSRSACRCARRTGPGRARNKGGRAPRRALIGPAAPASRRPSAGPCGRAAIARRIASLLASSSTKPLLALPARVRRVDRKLRTGCCSAARVLLRSAGPPTPLGHRWVPRLHRSRSVERRSAQLVR